MHGDSTPLAYAVAGSLLDGTRGRGFTEIPGPALACLLEDAERQLAVLWRQGGRQPRRFFIPADPARFTACDMMGNRVSPEAADGGFHVTLRGEPLYLVAPRAHGRALCDALERTRPSPSHE